MKRLITWLLVLALSAGLLTAAAFAEEDNPAAETPVSAAAVDDVTVTEHSAVIAGKTVEYTATAGTMALVTDGGGQCEIFYTAYTVDGAASAGERPLTFVFNGGPGSSSEWMHMGFLGPRRIDFDENGKTDRFPVPVVDNKYSILDLTDLVFIDPVGTGYSRPAEGSTLADFAGYDNDISSIGDFIRLYVNRNGRWSSPKYVAGESYGTMRAVGLCRYLADRYSLDLNGLILVSSINDFTVIMEANESDLPYVLYLPTYAADAWYHDVLAQEYQDMPLEDYLEEVRAFAGGEYLSALHQGRRLDAESRQSIASRLAAYTGLDAEYILKANLRVEYRDFCTQLLSDRKLVIGRLDGRYTGPATEGDMGSGSADPSNAAVSGIFSAAVNAYINDELGYHTDRPYETLSADVGAVWNFPEALQGFRQQGDIYEDMSTNSFLKVWVLCGYYDMATPFHVAEWVFDHVFLNEESEDNLQFTYYPSGHMIYLYEPALAAFREQAEQWYKP